MDIPPGTGILRWCIALIAKLVMEVSFRLTWNRSASLKDWLGEKWKLSV